jgi:predicted MFS family arabinose efflux permease
MLFAIVVIVFGVLSTTLAQTQVLGRIPLQNLLKNALHVDRSANAAFFFWITLPWYFKPLAGIVSDAFPLFGSRRRSYLLIGAALSTAAWGALTVTPQRYGAILATCLIINVAMMLASTVVGGYLVQVAQGSSSSGRLTSVRNFIEQFSWIVAGPSGGFLGSFAFAWTAIACGSVAFLVVPVALWFMREHYRRPAGAGVLQQAGRQVAITMRSRTMWIGAAVAGLFYFAPGLATAVFYKQQNDLHMQTPAQGFLVFVYGVGGVAAASLYGGFACRRFTLRTLLVVCILCGAAANLAYLFYTSVPRAQVIECLNGFGYTLAEVAIMHLMVRATPAGSEALGFALLIAVRNFGLFGADWFGSYLLDHYHIRFNSLVITNGLTSLLALPLILLLPAIIVEVRDTRASAATAAAPAPVRAVQE